MSYGMGRASRLNLSIEAVPGYQVKTLVLTRPSIEPITFRLDALCIMPWTRPYVLIPFMLCDLNVMIFYFQPIGKK